MAKQDRLSTLLILLAASLCTLPLLLRGCSCGHDLGFHLLSWQDAAAQFAHGNLHPRWATTPGWGAGEPRFIFYPPLSWTLGGLLTLLSAHLPGLAPDRAFALTPALFTFVALALAGLSMRRLARQYVSPAAATLAATVYLANPYTLFTAYERTAFAELLAAAWLPLLLAALLPPASRALARSLPLRPATPLRSLSPASLAIPATALPLALLWLTNAPAAVIGSYTLALVVLLRLAFLAASPGSVADRLRRARPLALRALAATALGFALAAFFIVPAATERRWVSIDMVLLPSLRPVDNTLFHHFGDPAHDQVLHTASLLAVALLLVTAVALAISLLRSRRRATALGNAPSDLGSNGKHLLWTLAALTLSIAILLTPVSLPLWNHLPELRFLQFPWRLLALLAPIATLALARLLPSLRLPPAALAALALVLPACLAVAAFPQFHLRCDPEDTPEASFALVHALNSQQPVSDLAEEPADDPTDEYTPLTADNDQLRHNNPPVRLLPSAASDDLPPPPSAVAAPAPLHLDLRLQNPTRVVLNLREYPLWVVENNGKIVPNHLQRDDGLLAVALPAGPAHLTLSLRTPPQERAANALSLVALCVLLILSLVHRSSNPG